MSATEDEKAERVAPVVDHEFSVRYEPATAGIVPADRIAWRGRLFEVVTITDVDGRNDERRGTAKELQ